MKAWFQNLNSLDWWIGVVAVGIVINLVSAYLKGPCDRLLSAVSKRWATRTEAQRKARDERIARLRASRDEQTFALIQALHVRVRSVMMILLGWVLMVTSLLLQKEPPTEHMTLVRLILMLASLLPMMLGFRDWSDVMRRRNEIYEARKPAA